MKVRRLNEDFVVMRPNQNVDPVPVTSELYAELDARYGKFAGHTLVAWHEFSSDWNSWERHPAGDELVVLLHGAATMIVRAADREHSLSLTAPGDYCIVPAGLWHTAHVSRPTRMLFITPGEGTENRERPPAAP